jgi:protein TonB
VQTNFTLIGALTANVNDRPFLGVLTVFVVLLHMLVVLRLLQPSDEDKINKPVKVVEVVILPPEPVVPKEKAAPPAPAPAKPVAPKKPPPKKTVKPVVKKEALVQKKPEPIKTEPEISDKSPVLPSPTYSAQKPSKTAVTTAPSSSKLVAKPGNGGSSGVVAITRIKPAYPPRAASRHIEGWVKIEFTVTPSGAVTSPSVVSASPPGIFDEAALNAIRQWKFKPRTVNGTAVTQRAVQTLKFTLLQ